MDSIECLWPSFDELSAEQYEKIQKNSFLVKHKKGEQVFIQDQPVSHLILIDKMINLSRKQIPGRIAEILLFFSRNIYRSKDFELPLSRQELADLVSTTKESISRTLTEFKNDWIIDITDRQVELKSIELLEILSRMG